MERLAREAITSRKIPFLNSSAGEEYHRFTIKGVGNSEDDDKGALNHFIRNLYSRDPIYVSNLEVGFTRDSRARENRRSISVIGYEPRPSSAT
ncbi:MAG: hypothetical protein AAB875_01500 [Patescibacteria group bacterium]